MSIRKTLSLLFISLLFLSISPRSIPFSFAEEEIADPSFKEKKAQEGYVLNLKDLIKKSKEKIEKVDDELQDQARKRRNQQREEKAREYYEKAMRFHEEGKLEEAQEYWDKAVKITEHPEMKDYVSESAKKSKRQEDALQKEEDRNLKRLEVERGYSAAEVEKAYQAAVSLFKQKKYIEAKSDFELVDEMFPDHKATRSYLMIIEQEIKNEQDRLIEENMRQDAIAKQREKEEWRKNVERKENERQETIAEQAEKNYQEALELYKAGQFERAKDKFKEVEWISPAYKSTENYLAHLDKDIETGQKRLIEYQKASLEKQAREDKLSTEKQEEVELKRAEKEEQEKIVRMKEEAEFVYEAAVSLYKAGAYEKAQEKFEEVQRLYPSYKSTDKYLTSIERTLADKAFRLESAKTKEEILEAKAQEELLAQEEEKAMRAAKEDQERSLQALENEAKLLYKAAIDLYDSQLYAQSLDKFQELEKIAPDYKSSFKYVEKIGQKLNIPVPEKQAPFDEYAFNPDGEEKQVLIKKLPAPAKKKVEEKKSKKEEKLAVSPKNETPVVEDTTVHQAELERRKQFEQDAGKKYAQALDFYRKEEFLPAKHKFIEVEALYPGYKDTLSYLAKIDDKIVQSENNPPSKQVFAEGKSNSTIEKVKEPATPKKEKSKALTKILSVQDEGVVQARYEEGIQFYREKQYVHAKEKFMEVMDVDPVYKSTQSYMKKIYTAIEKDAVVSEHHAQDAEWEMYQDERVALLKAKEEHLEELQGERYKEFKATLEEERRAIEAVEKERQRRDALRKKGAKNRFRAEDITKLKEQQQVEKMETMKLEEEKRFAQEKELEEKKQKQQEEKQAKLDQEVQERQRIQEEKDRIRQEKEERVAKMKEEKEKLEQLKEEQKQKELEAKKIAQEIADKENSVKEQEVMEAKKQEDDLKAQQHLEEEARQKEELVKKEEEAKKLEEEKRQRKAQDIDKQKEKLLDEYADKEYKQDIDTEKAKRYRLLNDKEQARRQKELKKQLALEQKAIQKYLNHQDASQRAYISPEVEKIYKEGVDLYRKGNYRAAKGKFSMVSQMRPGYKAVDSYLDGAERVLIAEENQIKKEVKKDKVREIQDELDKNKEEERQARLKAEEELKQQKLEEKNKKEEERQSSLKAEEEIKQKKIEEKERIKKEKEEALAQKRQKKQKQEPPVAPEEVVPATAVLSEKPDEIKNSKIADPVQSPDSAQTGKASSFESSADENNRNAEELKAIGEKVLQEEKNVVKLEQDEKKKQLKIAKDIERKRKQEEKDALLQKRQDEKRAKEMEKERKELEVKKDGMEKGKQKEDIKRLKAELNQIYTDAVGLYKIGKYDLSFEKFKQFEDLLASNSNNIESDYLKKMRNKLDHDRESLNNYMKKDREKRMQEVNEKEDGIKTSIVHLSEERSRELQDLEKKIKMDEERLAKEKLREEERLKQLKIKEEQKLNQQKKKAQAKEIADQKFQLAEKLKEDAQALPLENMENPLIEPAQEDQKPSLSQAERKRMEAEKREELQRLVKQREDELRKERERIQQELQNSIEELYVRAVNLHKSGMDTQAIHILEQVEEMMPGYKNTKALIEEYNASLNKQISEPAVKLPAVEKKVKKQKKAKAEVRQSKEVNKALDKYYDKEMDKAQTLKSREDVIKDALNSIEQSL